MSAFIADERFRVKLLTSVMPAGSFLSNGVGLSITNTVPPLPESFGFIPSNKRNNSLTFGTAVDKPVRSRCDPVRLKRREY